MSTAKAERKRGFALWVTGLPSSGKSTIVAALQERLKQRGIPATVLESDALRISFSDKPSYSVQDREYFYGSLAFIGKVLTDNGVNVIFDATANLRAYRDRARGQIPHMLEVYVDTPLHVCMQRDAKGIYRKAASGEAQNVPGLGARYEPPPKPELVIHGDQETPESSADRILQLPSLASYLQR